VECDMKVWRLLEMTMRCSCVRLRRGDWEPIEKLYY
jgi:hypothetical protein